MTQVNKIRDSRDNWKNKTASQVQKNKNLKKGLKRAHIKIDTLKAELEAFKKKFSSLPVIKDTEISAPISKQDTRNLCLMIVLYSSISFRSAPRILHQFNEAFALKLNYLPHFTSVINWSLRLGLGLLNQVTFCSEPWIAIVDHSIGFGVAKTLVVLRVGLDVLTKKGGAITLKDCECIGIKICETVNGESTSLDLEEIFQKSGHPAAILKDCDSSLNKGYHLYCEKKGEDCVVIDDLSHCTANALKAEFDESEDFKLLKILSADGGKRLRQTEHAYLTPPKIRKKGRFMSISNLAKWYLKISELLSVKGKAKKGSRLEKLREAFPGFLLLKPFIQKFSNATSVTASIMGILKNKGLSLDTFKESMALLDKLPSGSIVKERLDAWLRKHISIQQSLGPLPLLISSDIIESLFGKFKSIKERTPQSEMNRSALLLPALCGDLKDQIIENAMRHASQQKLINWENKNVPTTMRKKRHAVFAENGIQKEVHEQAA